MFRHGPSCLEGPVSRMKEWWLTTPAKESELSKPSPPGSCGLAPCPLAPDAPMRVELVERVRHDIASGTYDTPEKWQIALERLLDRLEAD